MRMGYIFNNLTSVDIQEIVRINSRVIEIFQSVFCREHFKVSPFKKVFDKLFELQQKYKDENNEFMQLLKKIFMNGLYREQIRKDITDSYQCKSENWVMTEYDE